MLKRADIRIVLLLFVLTGWFPAWAQAEDAPAPNVDQAKVEQLTDLVMQALPYDEIARKAQEKDPNWPMGEKADRVSAEQLKCMKDQYSTENYREVKRQDAIDFATRYPDEMNDAVHVLQDGAAEAFSAFFHSMMTSPDREIDSSQVMGQFDPKQVLLMVALMGDDKYRHLRDLIGFGGNSILDGAGDGVKSSIAKLMLRAMSTCKIPMSVLLN